MHIRIAILLFLIVGAPWTVAVAAEAEISVGVTVQLSAPIKENNVTTDTSRQRLVIDRGFHSTVLSSGNRQTVETVLRRTPCNGRECVEVIVPPDIEGTEVVTIVVAPDL